MTQKKNLDSGLTPPETKAETPPEEKIVKKKDMTSLEEKVDMILEGVTALLKQGREQAEAVDLEKRRGKFGTQVPPIPNMKREVKA